MKYALLISFFVFISCNGKLTDEQKRKIREEREESQIKKISDADITEAAFEYGRTITDIIEKRDKSLTNKILIDSLEKAFEVEIISMKTDDSTLRAIEKKVIEAYTSDGNSATLSDNVQKVGKDSVLYTKPLMRELPDGSVEFTRALGLRIAKRQIIRSIK
jgi:nitrous oxide reductase